MAFGRTAGGTLGTALLFAFALTKAVAGRINLALALAVSALASAIFGAMHDSYESPITLSRKGLW